MSTNDKQDYNDLKQLFKLSKLSIGDKVIEHRKELCKSKRQGVVTAISNDIITCSIETPDSPRIMQFDRKIGTNVLGIDFGYITADN